MKKRLVILGAGKSGIGTAILGKQKGYDVFVSDSGKISEKYKNVLLHNTIKWEENQHSEEKILTADVVMKSPGIPDTISIVEKLKQKGVLVISEIEFASHYTHANLIAITGSNGKTTVTNWIHHTLKKAGLNCIMAGNMGVSFAKTVAEKNPEYCVLEVSSFQLDGIVNFHPHIAVLTNITPDHLDRYDHDFQKYINAKFRITENQTANDFFIYDADDEVIKEQLKTRDIKAKKLPFSFKEIKGDGTEIINNRLTTILENIRFTMTAEDIALKGKHNSKNAMAASTVANLLKIRKQTIRASLESFQGVEHRLENVLRINNVQFINDSKATNINATYFALESVKPQVIWIVGGEDKGNDYSELLSLVNEKVKGIICLGVDNKKIIESFDNCVEKIFETQSMTEAVRMAYSLAESGDTVLLSPACASFDLFENYEDRGCQFKESVRNL